MEMFRYPFIDSQMNIETIHWQDWTFSVELLCKNSDCLSLKVLYITDISSEFNDLLRLALIHVIVLGQQTLS